MCCSAVSHAGLAAANAVFFVHFAFYIFKLLAVEIGCTASQRLVLGSGLVAQYFAPLSPRHALRTSSFASNIEVDWLIIIIV